MARQFRSARLLLLVLAAGVLALRATPVPAAHAATIAVPCASSALIDAINTANSTPEADILALTPGCTYTLTTLNNGGQGPAGLPMIRTPITIDGGGATITRDPTAPAFRILVVFGPTGGNLTLRDAVISGGSVPLGDAGGGIFNAGGTLTVIGSTITGNVAASGGGGIANNGTLVILNSTFANNSAPVGSAIHSNNNGTVRVTNATIAGNSASANGGAVSTWGPMMLRNTLLANNAGGNCSVISGVYLPVIDGGHNLRWPATDTSCPATFAVADSVLGPLQNNGGPTPTMALGEGSAAVDAIPVAECTDLAGAAVTADQRGVSRPQDGNGDGTAACDIGAYERGHPVAFRGFLAPVDNPPTVNGVRAGGAVPVKFSLGGDQGLNIFAPGYPASRPVACDGNAPLDEVEQTLTAGGSSLSYDATTDTYTYVWKTESSWAGTCRELTLRFTDGAEQRAWFRFK